MITKERLEELKNKDALVWYKIDGYYYSMPLSLCDIELKDNYLVVNSDRLGNLGLILTYEDVTENEEEVLWDSEFGHIKRTETLSLPSWEEMQPTEDEQDVYYNFVLPYSEKNKRWCLGGIRVSEKTIAVYKNYAEFNVKDNTLLLENTKENYIEACRLCKKLFLGDSDE